MPPVVCVGFGCRRAALACFGRYHGRALLGLGLGLGLRVKDLGFRVEGLG